MGDPVKILADKWHEAIETGTPEQAIYARERWQAAAHGLCWDCNQKLPLHPWMGRHDLICEGCDEVRRLDLDAHYDDQRAHERAHAPEVWGF